jgi:WD40 repeat protein
MTPEEIEKAQLALERKQLELDKAAAERDRNFFNRNTGVLISAAVSFVAVIVSISQVWVTTISKDKELEITILQHKADIESQQHQKDRELAISEAQRKRELDLSAARFITENRKAIFQGSAEEKELFARLIPTLFPPDVSAPLLRRLENATPGPGRKIWEDARKNSITGVSFSPDGRLLATIGADNIIRILDAASGNEVRSLSTGSQIVSSVVFSPDGRELVVTMLDGSLKRWDLFTGKLLQSIARPK